MAGIKRDHAGNEKEDDPVDKKGDGTGDEKGHHTGGKREHHTEGKKEHYTANKDGVKLYTSMFEGFRDELDEHHDRRQRIGKVSRDVTAKAKKVIFSLQRVLDFNAPIPVRLTTDIQKLLQEIKDLLITIESDVQGINRYRYSMPCLEEYVEAVSFAHYLEQQILILPAEAQAALGVNIDLTPTDYIFGIFDLTGEMMRFATAATALNGGLPSDKHGRTILTGLQEVSSMLQIVPSLKSKGYEKKVEVMVEQVKKVERIGYGVAVRGGERPTGWVPDMNDSGGGRDEREGYAD